MGKIRGGFLLMVVIALAILLALNMESIRSQFSSDDGVGRLDTAAGETAARSALGAIKREADSLKSFSGGELSAADASSLSSDPAVSVTPDGLGDYTVTYTFKTTTSDGECRMVLSSGDIYC